MPGINAGRAKEKIPNLGDAQNRVELDTTYRLGQMIPWG